MTEKEFERLFALISKLVKWTPETKGYKIKLIRDAAEKYDQERNWNEFCAFLGN